MKMMLFAWFMAAGVLFGQDSKEAAFQAWIAQGGILPGKESAGRGGRKPGVFYQGPMKGLTMAQARQRFETMWASAPESVKNKYQKRVAGGVIPPREEAPIQVADTSETDRKLEEIRLRQEEAERKRQEMEWRAERERREIERQQQEIERRQRELERQQEEAGRE